MKASQRRRKPGPRPQFGPHPTKVVITMSAAMYDAIDAVARARTETIPAVMRRGLRLYLRRVDRRGVAVWLSRNDRRRKSNMCVGCGTRPRARGYRCGPCADANAERSRRRRQQQRVAA
jgi:hypothetical protein